MFFQKLIFVISLNAFLQDICGIKLPDTFPKCRIQDENIQECMTKSAQTVISILKNGIPELDFPTLDPFHIDSLLLPDLDGPVTLSQKYSNAILTGLGDIKIINFTIDKSTYRIQAKVTTPQITFYGDYEVSGHILVLPMVGTGKVNFTLSNISSDILLEFNVIEKNEIEYLEITKVHVPIEAEQHYFRYDNLFNGNKTLGDNMNAFLNEHAEEVAADMRPVFEAACDETFEKYLNKLFTNVPLSLTKNVLTVKKYTA
ncbi:protein takeout-like [Chrysoperla carnea]|uniref:protein takeout-like n=1 Tax=Chrysoperla carnea TaxID=189513 RepID=UPI001D08C787|nr:protein takeout-like [Chrysoperla carnea]